MGICHLVNHNYREYLLGHRVHLVSVILRLGHNRLFTHFKCSQSQIMTIKLSSGKIAKSARGCMVLNYNPIPYYYIHWGSSCSYHTHFWSFSRYEYLGGHVVHLLTNDHDKSYSTCGNSSSFRPFYNFFES